MSILITIVIIVLLIVGAFVTYKTAEVHELHKMRAAFSDIKRHIELVKSEYEKSKNQDDYTDGKYVGELEEIDEAINIINDELNELKSFDFGNSD